MAMRVGFALVCVLLVGGPAYAQDAKTGETSKLDAPSGGGATPFGLLDPVPLEELGALAVVVVDTESGEPLVDAEVELLGTGRPASMTDAKGVARFEDCDFAHATLRVSKVDYVPALIHHPPREKADSPRAIAEMSKLAREKSEYPVIHGEALNAAKGTLLVRFEPAKNDELPRAIQVKLDAPGATAWVFDSKDNIVKGGSLSRDAKERTVVFPNVGAGTFELTADPGSGYSCSSSVGVVEAGVFTTVHIRCGKGSAEE